MQITDQRLADDALEQAEEAVRLAGEAFRANLDYSPASVEILEVILGGREQPLSESDEEVDVRRESFLWGAYLGEVMRRHFGWRWTVSTPTGVDIAMVRERDDADPSYCFPIDRVEKRLTLGETEIVHFYMHALQTE
jgi:hypothetical protein